VAPTRVTILIPRDDENWLCHSLYFPTDKRVGKRAVNFEPKTVDTFKPKARTY
jgi:succinate dehydrogenase / fumarate reductase flavoprotein subunit